MSTVFDAAFDTLKKDEGFRSKIYPDSKGILTAGYGRNMQGKGLSKEEAAYLLTNDVNEAIEALSPYVWYQNCNDARKSVLVNMTVNMNIEKILGFKRMIAALTIGAYQMAALEMLDSDWRYDVGPRAFRLAKIMERGTL